MCLAPPIQNAAKGTAQIWPKYTVADADAKYNSYTPNVLPVLIHSVLVYKQHFWDWSNI